MSYVKLSLTIIVSMAIFFWGYGKYKEGDEKEEIQKVNHSVYLAEGFGPAQEIKTRIAEYYFLNGKFPASNEDINIPAPTEFNGQSLVSASVSGGGVIELKYNKKSGIDNGVVRITPKFKNTAMGLQWKCITPSYENITLVSAQCKYQR